MLNNLDFLTPGQSWPPESEKERLQKYIDNKNLFKGKHDLVFREWMKLLREDIQAGFEIILNWPKRISTLWADLLLGERPGITAMEENEIETLKALTKDNFFITAYEVALDGSRYGDGLIKIRYDGEIFIEGQPPSVWFPVTAPDNLKNITHHVLAWEYNRLETNIFGTKNLQWYLKVEIHEKGKITSQLFKMSSPDSGDRKIESLVPDSELIIETGINDFLIVQIPNLTTTDQVTGIDDYDDIQPIVQALEGRISQVDKILDLHSSPNMYGPSDATDEDPTTGIVNFRAHGKYFPVENEEKPPGYITWDGQLEPSFKQLEFLMEQFYIISETSPACFGQLKAGLAESGTALKRLMMVPLAKVNRIKMRFDPALRKVLSIASSLESMHSNNAIAIPDDHIKISWQDGLPADDKEQAEIMNIRTGGKPTISQRSAIKKLDGLQEDEVDKELEEIQSEDIGSNPLSPSVFAFGGNRTFTPQDNKNANITETGNASPNS